MFMWILTRIGGGVQAIWYNNKLHGGTRNETRLTGFGGAGSALLDPDSTGALTVFAFSASGGGPIDTCNIRVCRDAGEEDIVEERVGAVDPGHGVVWPPRHRVFSERLWRDFVSPGSCWLKPDEIPSEWSVKFPSGADIVAKAVEMRPESTRTGQTVIAATGMRIRDIQEYRGVSGVAGGRERLLHHGGISGLRSNGIAETEITIRAVSRTSYACDIRRGGVLRRSSFFAPTGIRTRTQAGFSFSIGRCLQGWFVSGKSVANAGGEDDMQRPLAAGAQGGRSHRDKASAHPSGGDIGRAIPGDEGCRRAARCPEAVGTQISGVGTVRASDIGRIYCRYAARGDGGLIGMRGRMTTIMPSDRARL